MNTMTETEAREKWCPMAREMNAWNKDYKCIASKCMAWRRLPLSGHISDIVRHETGKGWVEWIKDYRGETGADLQDAKRELERRFGGRSVPSKSGYCGAFGRPDE